jgi:hypothetical protein
LQAKRANKNQPKWGTFRHAKVGTVGQISDIIMCSSDFRSQPKSATSHTNWEHDKKFALSSLHSLWLKGQSTSSSCEPPSDTTFTP